MDSEKKQVYFEYVLVFFFAVFMGIGITAIVVFAFPEAFAEVDIERTVQELKEERDINCEVWQTTEYMWQPVVIEMQHDKVVDTEVKVEANDPESDPVWRKGTDLFTFETQNYTDSYYVEVILPYEFESKEPRNVFYRIFTNENVLTHEGNWWHEGQVFCKIFSFRAELQPEFPTPIEIVEAEREFFQEELDNISDNQDDFAGLFGWFGIVVLAVGVLVGVIAIVVLTNMGKITKKVDEPVTEYKKLNGKFINLIKYIQRLGIKFVSDNDYVVKRYNETEKNLMIIASGKIKESNEQPLSTDEKIELTLEDEEVPVPIESIPRKNPLGFMKKVTDKIHKKDNKSPQTEEEWIEHFMKNTYRENLKIDEDLRDEYSKDPTSFVLNQLNALVKVMGKQV